MKYTFSSNEFIETGEYYTARNSKILNTAIGSFSDFLESLVLLQLPLPAMCTRDCKLLPLFRNGLISCREQASVPQALGTQTATGLAGLKLLQAPKKRPFKYINVKHY